MIQKAYSVAREPGFPWLLFSDRSVEDAFRDCYFDISLRHGRLCHWLAIVFYCADGIRDPVLFPSQLPQMMIIRFGIITPVFIAGFIFSHVRVDLYRKFWQPLFCFYVLMTGCGVIAMTALIPPPMGPSLYVGLLYCLVFGYTFIRLRFGWAAAGLILTVGYLFSSLWITRLSSEQLWLQVPFVLGINGFGLVVAWHMESLSRKDFFLQELLRAEKENVVNANDALEFRVKERTQELELSTAALKEKVQDLEDSEQQRRKLEFELRQAHKMEAIGTLAGGIAHDFNNILMSIIGYTELSLEESRKGAEVEEELREVLAAGLRARELIKQILTFARQSDETLRPIRPRPVVSEALKLIRSSVPSTIEIRSEMTSDGLVMGNPTQIHQIVMNLCANAAKAMETDGGVLEVGLKDVSVRESFQGRNGPVMPGRYVLLRVSDTGIGIAPDVLVSMFEPYYTTREQGEGTGMGLALVDGIVEGCGGRILVESQPGKGSVFKVYFPVTRKRAEESIRQAPDVPGGSEHILFVDDEAPITQMVTKILESLGYRVSARTSSIEALALIQARPGDVDLVITDMTMPNITGDRLAQEIMSIRPDLPVILCTGFSRSISREQAEAIGIRSYINKPLVRSELAVAIRRVLDEEGGHRKTAAT